MSDDSEKTLKEPILVLRTLIDALPDHLYVKDKEGRTILANMAQARALGLSSPDEVIGKTDAEFHYTADTVREIREHDLAVMRAGQPITFEEFYTDLAGKERWMATTKAPLRDASGNVNGVLGISRDITERKQAESLMRTERDLATALSAATGLLEGLRLGLEAALRVSETDCGGVYVVDETSGALDLVYHTGRLPPDFIESASHYDADSPNARLVMAGKPIYARHRELGVPLDDIRSREALRAMTVIPVCHMDRVIGCLNVASHTLDEVPLFARDALEMIAAQMGSVIVRLKAEEAQRRRAEELAALQATVLQVTASHDLPTLLQTVVERAALLLNAPGGGLYLCDPDRGEVRCVVSYNTPHDYSGTVLKYGEGAAGTVAQTGQPLIIDDYRIWDRRAAVYEEERPFLALLSAPMIWQGQVTGVIHVLRDVEGQRFTQADLELLILFANHAAIAVENARLYAEAQREIDERRRAEEELRQSEEKLRLKLDKILSPDYVIEEEEFRNIIDSRQIQSLMDDFYALTHIGIAILDMKGNILVATGWQDICTRFHRVHKESCKNCSESDLYLTQSVKPGEYVIYKCKNNMWDMVTPIIIGGKHMGKLFLGQFFYDDEIPDREVFAAQADRFGFNKEEYLAALERVPRWSRDRVKTVMSFYSKFAQMVSRLSFSNLKLAKSLSDYRQAEETLAHERDLLYALMDNIPDKIYFKDTDSRFIRINRAEAETLGVGLPEEAVGKTDFDYFAPDHARDAYADERRIVQTGEPLVGKIEWIRRADGEHRWFTATKVAIKDKGGRVTGIVGISRDITEQKGAEEELRKERDLVSRIMETSPVGIVALNREGEITFANAAAEKVLGLSRDEATERTYNAAAWSITDYDGSPFPDAELPFRRVMSSGQAVYGVRHAIEWPDGQRVLLSINAAPVFTETGEFDGVVAAIEDITERKRAEEALAKERYLLRTVIDNVPDHIFFKDTQGRIVLDNVAHAQFLGAATPDQVIGKTDFDFFPEELAAAYRSDEEALIRTGQAVIKEEISSDRTGRLRWDSTIKVPLRNAQGAIEGLVGLCRDITEQKRVEEELRKERDRSETYLNTAEVMLVALNEQGNITLMNRKGYRILGHAEGELAGKNWFDTCLPARGRDEVRAVLQRFMAGETEPLEYYENPVLTRDGAERIIAWHNALLRDEAGHIIGTLSSGEDITERRQVEEALRAKEHQIQESWRSVSDVLFFLSVEPGDRFRFLSVNQSFLDTTGLPENQVVGKYVHEVIPEPSLTLVLENYKQAIRDGKAVRWDEVTEYPAGRKYGEVAVTPIFDTGGRCTNLVGSVHDMTEHKRAEKALRESEERFRLAFENANIGMCLVDLEGRMTRVNRQMCEMFGYSREELESMTVNDLTHPEDLDLSPAFIQRASSGETEHGQFEKRYFDKQGHLVWGQVTSSLVRDSQGAPLHFISHVLDITERKRAEVEKETMQAQLLQSQKLEAVGTLAGGVAHDFNNLLTAILGYAGLAMGGIEPDHPAQKDLSEVQKAAARAAALTRQLLIFSRKQPMEFAPVNLNHTVEGLLKMLGRLIGEDIVIETDLATDLWTVVADTGQLEQVLMNLAVNARDAMPHGGKLTLRTENVTYGAEDTAHLMPGARLGCFVRLSVTDTGTGMDRETLEHIFEPFFTTKGEGKGTGLGLSVVYGIVAQHKGWVNVYSEPGHGSIFAVYLPAISSALGVEKEKETWGLEALAGHGERILVVEDQAEVRRVAIRLLEEGGYTVFEAANGEAALEVFEREKGEFDLVFSDVILPDFDGIQLLDELRRRQPDCRVLLASGYTDEKSQWPLIRARGYAYIGKPYKIADLLRAIREQIGPAR